jgi:hypothetical protein
VNGPNGLSTSSLNDTALHDDAPEVTALLTRYNLIGDVESEFSDFAAVAFDGTPDETNLNAAITALHAATDADTDGTPAAVGTARTAFNAGVTAYTTLTNDPSPNEAAILAEKVRLRSLFSDYRNAIEAAYQPEVNLRNLFPAYRSIAEGLNDMAQPVPPSGAAAGVYARTDAQRGVWKAPANESVLGVLGPTRRFTRSELENLNVNATSGKSINAIRAFTGKGTLIYGARTLAGNDGENRYVNVRRLLIFLEESIKKASEQFVFEPNDANTWVRVRGMIENFLDLQWRAGALQGARAQDAYRVAIGLGRTMTADDVTSGRMIVEISLAPVRPAEFIILRFSQQQAQS